MTRLYLIAAAVVLVLIGGAFFLGRWTAPQPAAAAQEAERIEAVRQVVVTRYVDRAVTRTKHTVETKTPDGSTTTTTDETEHNEEKTTEVPPPPDQAAKVIAASSAPERMWRAGVSVGLTINRSSGMVPEYGGELDRRLVGPLWLGIRANTGGYVGAAIGVEF